MATLTVPVPFYSNTPDDMHCAQATLRSIRAFFEPGKEIGWDVIDAAMANPRGTGTWRMAGMLWMYKEGYEVRNIEMLDYGDFARRGLDYYREYVGEGVAEWEAKMFDIPYEQRRAMEFVQHVQTERRTPTLEDIKRFLTEGYLVQLTVNAHRLNGKEGYLGHAVLVKGFDDEHVIVHDPGLPPKPDRILQIDVFEAAWANGYPEAKTLTAYRKTVA